MEQRTCQVCGKAFYPTQGGSRQKYCSQACCRDAYDARVRYRMPRAKRDVLYLYAGYIVMYNTPVEDYLDFRNVRMDNTDIRYTMQAGNFPPGLRLKCGGRLYQVSGRYNYPQSLEEVG